VPDLTPEDPATGLPTTPEDPGTEVAAPGATEPATPARPGLSTFTIEGRAAPGLFVVGWLASISGFGLLVVGYLAPRSIVATVLIIGGLVLLSIGLVSGAGAQTMERRSREASYSGPSPFLLFAGAVAVASLLSIFVGLAIRLIGGDPESPVATLLLLAVIQVTYLGLTRLLVVGSGALSWADMGVRPDVRRGLSDLAWGAWFALPIIGLTYVVAWFLSQFISAVPESPLPPTGTTSGLILNLIGGAIFVPIGEELVFRGVATTAWSRVYGPGRAIIQGALFFAVVHVLQIGGTSPDQAIQLAVLAFVARIPVALALGWVFVARRSLWASIGLHAAFNGTLLILAELAQGIRPG
jgi:membrane protease YdiL (CAAX protease family)